MKAKQLLYAFLCMLLSISLMDAKSCVSPATVVLPQVTCNVNVVHISQADVGPNGYIISVPGRYCLVENITWTPLVSGTPTAPVSAITITASNVVLDLNGYFIQQAGTAIYTVGITITNGGFTSGNPNLNNIIVRNGMVQNIATAGMYIDPIDELLLEDLYVVKNGYAGYILCPCTAHRAGGIIYPSYTPNEAPPFQSNHTMRRVYADLNGGAIDATFPIWTHGINAANINSLLVEDSSASNNFNLNAGFSGFGTPLTFGLNIFNCNGSWVRNSQFNLNNSVIPFVQVCGLSTEAQTVGSTFIQNCTFNFNSSADSAYGVALFGNDVDILDCQANENMGGIYSVGFYTAGGFDITFNRCSAKSNSIIASVGAAQTVSVGWLLVAGENSLTECVAMDSGGLSGFLTNPNVSYGFISEASATKFENCKAIANGTFGNSVGGGFGLVARAITCRNCESSYNFGNAGGYQVNIDPYTDPLYVPNPADPFPIDFAYGIVIEDCNIHGFPNASDLLGNPNAIGIRLNDAKNCIITGNTIQTCAPDGILLTQTQDCGCINNIIKHNEIQNLFSSALPDANGPVFFGIWAIEDLTGSADSVPNNTYYDNYAWDYPGNGIITNYNTGVRAAGPVDPLYMWQWAPPGPINPTGAFSKMSNVDIITTPCVTGI